ncbi:hypothetical protein [Micromonospora zhanjiangensis]|uniref:DUF4190 domain-containing protein n=1 Tax=Micromonospora zhanjiangensis TaxID=1522057 RepID=A0ABV8KPQ0_9ACTN
MTSPATFRPARTTGGLLLWFAALGGVLAWTAHVLAAWTIDELTCASGHENLAGLPLTAAVGLSVAVPALVAVAALVVSLVAVRRLRRTGRVAEDQGIGRAHLLALAGVFLDLLSLAMIVLGGVAVLVFPACQR